MDSGGIGIHDSVPWYIWLPYGRKSIPLESSKFHVQWISPFLREGVEEIQFHSSLFKKKTKIPSL